MVDHNPEVDSASEGAEDLELEPSITPEGDDDKEPGVDPLDDIQDPKAREEAKKHRAIARRTAKPEEKKEVKTPVATAPAQEYVTKKDFHKSNERKAMRIATVESGITNSKGEVIMPPEDVKAHWNEILPFYTPRRGKETEADILEDIRDAVTVYRDRNPVVEEDDTARVLTETPVVKPGGESKVKTPKKPDAKLPGFNLPAQPKDWYSKPEPKT